LEALDPEQNSTFRDRYLETPYDLSKVLFLTTANTLDTIPAPLRDRMEIIQLSGYTLEEKTQIAKQYLLPKQLKANGLKDGKISFGESAYRTVIEGYTREAGVRSLEREIGSICRKVAVKQAKNKRAPRVNITAESVQNYLGAPKFAIDFSALQPQVGAVTGLAWTAVGGTTLSVEVGKMKGKGELKLTGHLGEVMKESAQTALSYLRAHAEEYGLDSESFSSFDLHIHVPEGATPKDGPSAGITIATAILSALTNKKVRGDIAMTGEVTLLGKVLPIGGLKEKALAARRVGITSVIIPKGNEKDLEEMPKELKTDITFIPVSEVKEVFETALLSEENQTQKSKKTATKKPRVPAYSTPENSGVRCGK
jgi:ATP-dependent Lon protease